MAAPGRPAPRLPRAASVERSAAALCEGLDRRGAPALTVMIDDMHLVHGTLAEERSAPSWSSSRRHARLAIAGRAAEPGALRVPRPEAVDLHERTLALGPGECGELLAALGAGRSVEQALGIHHRTEGWVTGVVIGAWADAGPGARGNAGGRRRDAQSPRAAR